MSSNNVPPPEADLWHILLRTIQTYGEVDSKSFQEFHDLIGPTPDLKSFSILAGNLVSIFGDVAVILEVDPLCGPDLKRCLPDWIRFCQIITGHADEIEHVIKGFTIHGKERFLPPHHGRFKSHPIPVALWCRPADRAHDGQFQLLQAFIWLSHYVTLELTRKYNWQYRQSEYNASLATRKLADDPAHGMGELLSRFPTTVMTFRAYYRELQKMENPLIHPLLRFLKFGLDKLQPTVRRFLTAHHRYAFDKKVQSVCLGVEEDFGGPVESLKVLRVPVIPKSQKKKMEKSLISPDEQYSDDESVVIEHPGKDPSGGLSPSQQYLKAKGSLASIVMHNQRLAYDWNRLTPYEINEFLLALRKLSLGQMESSYTVPQTELAAFLAMVFWTSGWNKQIHNCLIVPDAAHCSEFFGVIWHEDSACHQWVLKPFVPKQRLISDEVLKGQAIPLASRYTLPIPEEAAMVMQPHLQKNRKKYRTSRAFKEPFKDYTNSAEVFLTDLRRRCGGRQHLSRISVHLHETLVQQTGSDVTVAMAISGRWDILGSVQAHYTSLALPQVHCAYQTACTGILQDAGLPSPNISPRASYPGGDHVGSRYVPLQATVSKLVDQLKERLSESRKNCPAGMGSVIRLHNVMTVYTVMLIGYATGYRAVRDPLLQEAEIDRETGFASISDKDAEEFTRSRIVWLPEICLRQIDRYRQHLEVLQDWLYRHRQALFHRMREADVTGHGKNRSNPSLFILDKNIRDLGVRPGVLKPLVGTIDYQLPMNANRHFLRSNLVERGCPPEVIAAFMGHAEQGQEPWGRFSGLSPQVYRESLSEFLVPLLRESGWEDLPGLDYDMVLR